MTTGRRADVMPVFVSRDTAARLCEVSIDTFELWVRRGLAPDHVTPGKHRRWHRPTLEKMKAEGRFIGLPTAPPKPPRRPADPAADSFIYVIYDRSLRASKIGRGDNPEKRLSSMMTGRTVPLELLDQFPVLRTEAPKIERWLHVVFRPLCIEREWFAMRALEATTLTHLAIMDYPTLSDAVRLYVEYLRAKRARTTSDAAFREHQRAWAAALKADRDLCELLEPARAERRRPREYDDE